MKQNKALVFGSMLTALTVIALYFASVLPTNKLFLIALTTAIMSVSILTTGIKNSVLVYATSSILSFFLVSSKLIVISYILIFGIYSLVKLYLEKYNKLLLELVGKLMFFNLMLLCIYALVKLLLVDTISLSYSIYVIIVMAEVFFIIFDYALTVFITQFKKRYSRFLN